MENDIDNLDVNMKRGLSKNSLRQLFLFIVALIHFWTILITFWNFPESQVRLWTAIGLMSYEVLIAFFDSLILVLLLVLIGLILPGRWSDDKKLLFLGNLGFTIFLGLILGQYLDSSSLTAGQMWLFVGVVSLIFLIISEFFSLTRKAIAAVHLEFFNRLSTLAYIFLALDVISFVIVLIRNIFWVRMT